MPLSVRIFPKLFNQFTNKEYFDYFQFSVIVVSTEMNILVFVSLSTYFSISTGLSILHPIYNVEAGCGIPHTTKQFFDTN